MTDIGGTFRENLHRIGFAARSGARSRDYFNGVDRVLGPMPHDDGLHFTLIDPGHLDRGREHYLTIAYRVIDADYLRRNGDEIAELRAKVENLELKLATIRVVLDGTHEEQV